MPGSVNPLQQEGATEFFAATKRLVAMGEVVSAEGPTGSLLTGATGCWATGGILRDVRSAEDRSRPDKCHFIAILSGGSMPGRPGFGGGGNADPPEGFTKVFENGFGALWKNETPPPKGVPVTASVSALGLFVLAGVGLLLILLDFRLARENVRARCIIAGVAFLLASISLSTLAGTAIGELRHPPKAASAQTNTFSGGPSPGISPGGVDLAGLGDPAGIPEKLRAKFDRIHQFLGKTVRAGGDPRSVWSPEDQMRFRRLLEDDKEDEAEALLDQATQRMK
jgi:hypothetical protein